MNDVPPAERKSFAVLVAAGCLLGLVVQDASAQDKRRLEAVERQLERTRQAETAAEQRARKLAAEVQRLRRELIAAARAAQEREALLSRLEAQLPRLEAEAERRRDALARRRRQMQGTLGALVRLSRNPPQALMLSPGPPIEVVRSTMLLRAALPQLRRRAETLREEVAGLVRVRREIAAQRAELERTNASLADQRRRIESLLKQKIALRKEAEATRRRIAARAERLARKARNLRELFARLERERPPPPPARPALALPAPDTPFARPPGVRPFPARGPITIPAKGRIVERYGQSTGLGNTAKGVTIETRPQAQVVAPFDGRVVFAGPFRGYGQILIIEHGGAYHTLLAGLTRVDTAVGQWLLAGEPVGVMGRRDDNGGPRLYVEIRRKGQPINPLPWFAAGNNRVRG